jgi:hypothetical protein
MTGVQCPDNPLLGGEASGTKRVLADDPFLDGCISNQVLLDDAFASCRSHFTIPDTLRVDEPPWAFAADSQTCGLRSQDRNPKLLDVLLQKLPCLEPMVSAQQSGPTQRKTCRREYPMPILEKTASVGFILNFFKKGSWNR